eukprot:COSAG04_NODE_85_length_27560_cov_8.621245_3_plen_97_part_00
MFFRNYVTLNSGSFLVVNVWPMIFTFTDTDFVQNQNSMAGTWPAEDGYFWGSLLEQGSEKRDGFSSLTHSGTRYIGGYKSLGLMTGFWFTTWFAVG